MKKTQEQRKEELKRAMLAYYEDELRELYLLTQLNELADGLEPERAEIGEDGTLYYHMDSGETAEWKDTFPPFDVWVQRHLDFFILLLENNLLNDLNTELKTRKECDEDKISTG